MKPDDLNFRHLLYFWAVAKEGSITRAADRLGMSAQAISTQLSQLERQLGVALFAPSGRSLMLTDAGKVALHHADQVFQTGTRMLDALSRSGPIRPRLAVGVTDTVPKLVAFRMLERYLHPPFDVRLDCVEGEFDVLLGDLAVNKIDLLIADRSAPQRANLRLQSKLMGTAGVSLYGTPSMAKRYGKAFPEELANAPVFLPAQTNSLRSAIDAWFDAHEIRPLIVGEFSDSALLKTFGRSGLGLFPAPSDMEEDLWAQYGAKPLGAMDGVRESWFAIAAYRKLQHPAVADLLATAGAKSGGRHE